MDIREKTYEIWVSAQPSTAADNVTLLACAAERRAAGRLVAADRQTHCTNRHGHYNTSPPYWERRNNNKYSLSYRRMGRKVRDAGDRAYASNDTQWFNIMEAYWSAEWHTLLFGLSYNKRLSLSYSLSSDVLCPCCAVDATREVAYYWRSDSQFVSYCSVVSVL